jgi:hypothetical protein
MARASGEREKGREREEEAICPGTGWLVWAGPERVVTGEGVRGAQGQPSDTVYITWAVSVGVSPG